MKLLKYFRNSFGWILHLPILLVQSWRFYLLIKSFHSHLHFFYLFYKFIRETLNRYKSKFVLKYFLTKLVQSKAGISFIYHILSAALFLTAFHCKFKFQSTNVDNELYSEQYGHLLLLISRTKILKKVIESRYFLSDVLCSLKRNQFKKRNTVNKLKKHVKI